MSTLLQDVRYGIRVLGRSPGFAAVVVLTLAIGIGATTTIFSVFHAVLLKPLPYPESDRLLIVRENMPESDLKAVPVPGSHFIDYRRENQVFESVGGFESLSLTLTGAGEPKRLFAARASASLFPTLGVQPLIGRTFTDAEDTFGQDGVAVLSYGLWQRQFGGDTSIIGRSIELDKTQRIVIGVMPREFEFPLPGIEYARPAELWVPLALRPEVINNRVDTFNIGVVARLKAGVSPQQAEANLNSISQGFQRAQPQFYPTGMRVTESVLELNEQIAGGSRSAILVLFGAVGFVLLAGCANVANLLMIRAAGREREMAVRRAIGAGSWRLTRQLLTESILLGLAGGLAGTLLANWALNAIVTFGPDNIPRLQSAEINAPVLLFSLFISVLSALLFGLAPVVRALRINVNRQLKETTVARGSGSRVFRNSLVVIETVAAIVLLAGAGLLLNSFARIMNTATGFQPEGAVVTSTALPEMPRDFNARRRLYRDIHRELRALPGVKAVALSSDLPLSNSDFQIGMTIEGGDPENMPVAMNAIVTPGYFHAMGINLLRGRDFSAQDELTTVPVIIVNQAFARKYWPGEDAIGKRIRWGRSARHPWLSVIGVSDDVRANSLTLEAMPHVYMPVSQTEFVPPRISAIVRTDLDPASLNASIRQTFWMMDKSLPIYNQITLEQLVSASVSERRFNMLLLVLFAVSALTLTAIGIYGVNSYNVVQRTREIGIRMALGAREGDVLRLIMRYGLVLCGAGLLIGLPLTFALTRFMQSMLFEVSPWDAATMLCAAALLMIVAFTANYIPARRAARVNPMVTLRYE